MPRRIEDDVDLDVLLTERGDLRLHVERDRAGRRTGFRGERHLDGDRLGRDVDVVDEAEVVDVERDLGVEALADRFDHLAFADGTAAMVDRRTGGGGRGPAPGGRPPAPPPRRPPRAAPAPPGPTPPPPP